MNNPNEEAIIGQILWSNKNKNKGKNTWGHFIVYLGQAPDPHFIGAMLTHTGKYGNVAMTKEHFVTPDLKNGYDFKFENTHLVNQYKLKRMAWGPFQVRGQLTPEGIKFIQAALAGTLPEEHPDNA